MIGAEGSLEGGIDMAFSGFAITLGSGLLWLLFSDSPLCTESSSHQQDARRLARGRHSTFRCRRALKRIGFIHLPRAHELYGLVSLPCGGRFDAFSASDCLQLLRSSLGSTGVVDLRRARLAMAGHPTFSINLRTPFDYPRQAPRGTPTDEHY